MPVLNSSIKERTLTLNSVSLHPWFPAEDRVLPDAVTPPPGQLSDKMEAFVVLGQVSFRIMSDLLVGPQDSPCLGVSVPLQVNVLSGGDISCVGSSQSASN